MDASRVIECLNKNGLKCKFIPYEEMKFIKNVNELLPYTLILYRPLGYHISGHFCCVFNNKDGINFFDPIGSFDTEIIGHINRNIHIDERQETNQDKPYLTKLLSKVKKGIEFNDHELQQEGTDSCGAWCAIRMLYANLTTKQFNRVMNKIDKNDIDDKIWKLFFNFENN